MHLDCKKLVLATFVALMAILGHAQDSTSLGDAARQARQEKQVKNSASKSGQATTPKVITNEEISTHSSQDVEPSSNAQTKGSDSQASAGEAKISGEEWKSRIQSQKDAIHALQFDIDKLNDSIQFAPSNCVSGCVQWNEKQEEKQKRVEQMRSQLDTQKKRLQEMQDSAREQGYGSSVYDP